MTLVPLSTVPIEVRKEHAIELVKIGVLEGWEALRITLNPGDFLVPAMEFDTSPKSTTHWKDICVDCGVSCWTRGGTPRCRSCSNKARGTKERGYCANGHPWTEENVYTRPSGWQYCRECARAYKGQWRRTTRKRYRKVPCVECGEPATPPSQKRKDGKPFARCRACYMAAGGRWAK